MIKKTAKFLEKNLQVKLSDKILLAVSGGIDSMVLMNIIKTLGFQCIAAHCNFSLRGEESIADEVFVITEAEKLQMPLVSIKFDTENYAVQNKLSIQEAARKLRYEWFEEMRIKHNCNYIALAHNADDVIETFHINSMRASGIRGLRSIPAKNGYLIRPVLFAFRSDIETFANENNIAWRTDSSNLKTKYLRNKIRLDLIPQFEKLKDSYKKTLHQNIIKLGEAEQIYLHSINEAKTKVLSALNQETRIKKTELFEYVSPKTLLFEILTEFNFNPKQTDQIFENIGNGQGNVYYSKTHELAIEREFLSVIPVNQVQNIHIIINSFVEKIQISETEFLYFERIQNIKYEIEKSRNIALFDSEKLVFPLIIRNHKAGDKFIPLGMHSLKKLSDFFTDQKFSRSEKLNTLILQSNRKIAWLINARIDDNFKITSETKTIIRIEYRKVKLVNSTR